MGFYSIEFLDSLPDDPLYGLKMLIIQFYEARSDLRKFEDEEVVHHYRRAFYVVKDYSLINKVSFAWPVLTPGSNNEMTLILDQFEDLEKQVKEKIRERDEKAEGSNGAPATN